MRWGEAREGWKIERAGAGRARKGRLEKKTSELEPQELLETWEDWEGVGGGGTDPGESLGVRVKGG